LYALAAFELVEAVFTLPSRHGAIIWKGYFWMNTFAEKHLHLTNLISSASRAFPIMSSIPVNCENIMDFSVLLERRSISCKRSIIFRILAEVGFCPIFPETNRELAASRFLHSSQTLCLETKALRADEIR